MLISKPVSGDRTVRVQDPKAILPNLTFEEFGFEVSSLGLLYTFLILDKAANLEHPTPSHSFGANPSAHFGKDGRVVFSQCDVARQNLSTATAEWCN